MSYKGSKHLSLMERYQIESLYRAKLGMREIAEQLGRCVSTIYIEIKRGLYVHHTGDLWKAEVRYAPERAHWEYKERIKGNGKPLKIMQCPKLKARITELLHEGYSPAAALMQIKKDEEEYELEIKSPVTIYNYIKRGDVFEGITLEDLPYKPKKRRKKRVKVAKRANAGESIEKRPEEVENRQEFGHWEMDTVKGKQGNKKAVLVLTERKTRCEIAEFLSHASTEDVKRALNRIEERFGDNFGKIFKTITVDNGSEFADTKGIEKSALKKGKRTAVYYCHPYRSSERGSNENNNKLIRRHYPKGTDFDTKLSKRGVAQVQEWINNYPRKLFDGGTSAERFAEEIKALGIML